MLTIYVWSYRRLQDELDREKAKVAAAEEKHRELLRNTTNIVSDIYIYIYIYICAMRMHVHHNMT